MQLCGINIHLRGKYMDIYSIAAQLFLLFFNVVTSFQYGNVFFLSLYSLSKQKRLI